MASVKSETKYPPKIELSLNREEKAITQSASLRSKISLQIPFRPTNRGTACLSQMIPPYPLLKFPSNYPGRHLSMEHPASVLHRRMLLGRLHL